MIHQKIKLEQINTLIPYLKVNFWKAGTTFGVGLSHDVDHISLRRTFLLSRAKFWFQKRKFLPMSFYFKAIAHFLSLRDAINNFERYLKIEKKFQICSTFFFLPNTANELNEYTRNIGEYDVEIALHGGFNTCDNFSKLSSEKDIVQDKFNLTIKGIRQHYLEFKPNITWNVQKKCGLFYDSTLGFNRRAGYRTGTSFPYIPSENFVEIPLIFMDTIFNHSKILINGNAWKNYIFKIIDQVKSFNGLFTINWHNSNLEMPFNYYYKEIIKYLIENNCEFLKYKDIAQRSLLRKEFISKIKVDLDNKIIYAPYKDDKYSIFSLEYDSSIFSLENLP